MSHWFAASEFYLSNFLSKHWFCVSHILLSAGFLFYHVHSVCYCAYVGILLTVACLIPKTCDHGLFATAKNFQLLTIPCVIKTAKFFLMHLFPYTSLVPERTGVSRFSIFCFFTAVGTPQKLDNFLTLKIGVFNTKSPKFYIQCIQQMIGFFIAIIKIYFFLCVYAAIFDFDEI